MDSIRAVWTQSPYCSDAIHNTNRSNFAPLKIVERSDFGIDKPSDALFTIIFHDDKKDENKVIGNARIHVNSAL